jgi:DNA-binding transcriptional regulator PaaX
MGDLTGVEEMPVWASWVDLPPAAQACLLVVGRHDGDAWRGLIAQKLDSVEISDRHCRRMIDQLEDAGLIDGSGPTKRRETFALTDAGHEVIAGIHATTAQIVGSQ